MDEDFGFSAVSNEYINTPEATSSDNTYTVTIASITTQPPPSMAISVIF
jgi:hypothetical protein